ncbi:DNA topoisomerase [Plasmodium vivax North Korean]|uniref:DNA topoisomerase n=1 Tax=Plasmodium vivax North Korean TaxID=1035514 RepID=A0A0J9TM50_PLAVI|nr:DNA topoisomerase [Plasmodium vivax North Korean]
MREYGMLQNAKSESLIFKKLEKGKKYRGENIEIISEKSTPPPKYSEASLIKALEKKGIGRPSTYPKISQIVRSRNYANFENKRFEITELGHKVSKDLEKNFPNFISYDYTRLMEEELDNISNSKTD